MIAAASKPLGAAWAAAEGELWLAEDGEGQSEELWGGGLVESNVGQHLSAKLILKRAAIAP
eukprot:3576740-Pleurochrysis_carterae.AAC.1